MKNFLDLFYVRDPFKGINDRLGRVNLTPGQFKFFALIEIFTLTIYESIFKKLNITRSEFEYSSILEVCIFLNLYGINVINPGYTEPLIPD